MPSTIYLILRRRAEQAVSKDAGCRCNGKLKRRQPERPGVL
jgi:hypothetical protein